MEGLQGCCRTKDKITVAEQGGSDGIGQKWTNVKHIFKIHGYCLVQE